MEKVLELLGLKPDATPDQIMSAIKTIKSEADTAKEMASQMRKSIESLEEQLKNFSSTARDMQAMEVANSVQYETGRYLSKEHLPKLQAKAARYVMEKDEDTKKEIMEDMKTMTVAFGINSRLQAELSAMTEESDDPNTIDGETSIEKRVNKIKSLSPEMKYEEIISAVKTDEGYKNLLAKIKSQKGVK